MAHPTTVSRLSIQIEPVTSDDVVALLQAHVDEMHATSPPGSVHALDVEALRQPEITFFTIRDSVGGGLLVGCGALKSIGATHCELKSMRIVETLRGRGSASQLLHYILGAARQRGYSRISLETGAEPFFEPARAMYRKYSFELCEPFASYVPDVNSVFMTRTL